jgi:hypothetical protein
MRVPKLFSILYLLFIPLICSSQVKEELLNKQIQLNTENWTLKNLLTELNENYKIVFSYEPSEMPLLKEIKLPKGIIQLKAILERLHDELGIQYVMQSRVIILRNNLTNPAEKKSRCTISGIMSDSINSESLIGAVIYVNELKTGSVSNAYGFYSLTLPVGRYQFQISSIGYETQVIDISLSVNMRINFQLKPVVHELDEVVINNKRNVLKDFQQGVSRIEIRTVKELPSLFGEADLLKNILMLPGVVSMAEAGGDLQVRGGSWDQNLMLLDEAIVYNSNHLYGFYSTFNPDIIKDVKFYKGGMPAQYGGRISSVMDVTQKEGDMKSYHINGRVGLITCGLTVEGPILTDKSSFIIAARRSLFEPYLKFVNNENAKNVRPYFYDINSKINYIINENNRVYLSCYIGNDFIDQNIGTVNNSNVSYGNITGTLRFNHIFNDQLFSNTSVIFSKYNMKINEQNDTLPYIDHLGLEHYEIKNAFSYSLLRHKFDFGFQVINYVFHPGDLIPEDKDSSYIKKVNLPAQHAFEGAIFISDNIKITSSLEVQAGLRLSTYNFLGPTDVFIYQTNEPKNPLNITDTLHYGKNKIVSTYNHIEPRISLKYNITDNQTAVISYNKMAQNVQLVSRTFDPLPWDMWKPSDYYIKPLTGQQYSAGWSIQWPAKAISLSVESYYKFLENVVEVKPGTQIFLNDNLDAGLLQGSGRAYGVEFALNKTEGRFTGLISYTRSKTELKIDSKFLEDKINFGNYYPADYDIPDKFTLAGEFKVNSRLTFTASFFYQTGRPITLPSGQFYYYNSLMPYYSGKNQDRYPSYNRLDLGAVLYNKQKAGRRWQGCWTLSVYNVYSRENDYDIYISTVNNSQNTQATKMWFYDIIPSLTYSFKF